MLVCFVESIHREAYAQAALILPAIFCRKENASRGSLPVAIGNLSAATTLV
jgi:hypothetical protein